VSDYFGKLDILVSNAGISTRQEVGLESDIPALDRIWAVNTIGVIATIRAAAKVMTNGGRIITIGSGAGTRSGLTGLADYSGSKAAVGGYTRGAAHDLGPRGITVNLIESGLMATELGDSIPEDIKAMLVANLAIKRLGQLDEIAAAVTFLASPSASYITGATLAVDGGFAA
jgi:NAD(P)-dependent dehydrogenase (short-subunit alcohol dehydrogenase family)